MARVRGHFCCSLAHTSNSCGFGNAHPARKHTQLGLGVDCNPHDWCGFRLDVVGLSLFFPRHASCDAVAGRGPATGHFYVHRNVVVCRNLDRRFFVAVVAVFTPVTVVCEATKSGGVGGCNAWTGCARAAHGVCGLAYGRRTQGILGVAAGSGFRDVGGRTVVGIAHGIGVCFQTAVSGEGHRATAVCTAADPVGRCVGCGSHRGLGRTRMVRVAEPYPLLIGVSRRCCFLGGLELAVADAAANAVDQSGPFGLHLAFSRSVGHPVFTRSVTSHASRAYVPT